MPGVKPTNDQLLERVEFVQDLLCQGYTMGSIKKAVREKFGNLHFTTIGRLVLRARKQFAKDAERETVLQERAQAVRWCKRMLANPNVSDRDKLKAQELLSRLLGLDAPQRVDVSAKHTHTTKAPISIDYAGLERLRREVQGVLGSDGRAESVPVPSPDGSAGSLSGANRN